MTTIAASSTGSPSVSVLMPAYNRAHYIGEAIGTVLGQTYSELELIVVDDGSTDNTADVVQAVPDPRVRLIRQENKGIGAALNAGFRTAHGRYIARLDSDDRWLPEMLEQSISVLEADALVGLVYSTAQAIDAAGRPLPALRGTREKYPGETFKSLLYGDHVSSITAVVRREYLAQVGLWDEARVATEDWDIALRLATVCRFYFIPRVLAQFRIHTGRTTTGAEWHARVTLDRVCVLDKVYGGADVRPEAIAMKALAYRNVYTDVGLRWLGHRHWRAAITHFWKAIRVAPNPLATIPRIVYLVLFYNYLSRRPWAMRLLQSFSDRRRRAGS